MSKSKAINLKDSSKEDCNETRAMKAAKIAVLNPKKTERVNMSRRYFTIGIFSSAVLFKHKLINPSYQISRTGKFTIKLTMILYKLFKFILWSVTRNKK